MSKLDREQLICLVDQIANASACMMDLDSLLVKLESNVPHPNASELIFNPPCGSRLTPAEIVDQALAWKRNADED